MSNHAQQCNPCDVPIAQQLSVPAWKRQAARRRAEREQWEREHVRHVRRPERKADSSPVPGTKPGQAVQTLDDPSAPETQTLSLDPYTYAAFWWCIGGWVWSKHPQHFVVWAALTVVFAIATKPQYWLYSFFFIAGCAGILKNYHLI